MKLIHCADLHLDSSLKANLDGVKARERREELLENFRRLVFYAHQNRIRGILIAGDLFDTRRVSAAARNVVIECIRENSSILFFYLRGNHDGDNFLREGDEVPANLKLFGSRWSGYRLGRVVIQGVERNHENAGALEQRLVLRNEDFNIVMLHGQESMSAAGDPAERIDLRQLRGKFIDYLALGHIHTYKKAPLDSRGTYCYPGCLEGRGFDECGPHGFVVLEIDESTGEYMHTFVPFARRLLHEVEVEVSDCCTSGELLEKAETAVTAAGCRSEDLVKLILTGQMDVESDIPRDYLRVCFAERFYHLKIVDHTGWRLDGEYYRRDESLKGEFVRILMADPELEEEERNQIIRYGLLALAGEEIRL